MRQHDSATGHLPGGRGRPDFNAEEAIRSGQGHARHRGSKHQHDRAISQVKGTSKAAPNRPMLQRQAQPQARTAIRVGDVRDQSRMVGMRHKARGAAREPGGGTPERPHIDCQLVIPQGSALDRTPYLAPVRHTGTVARR